jgi:hypothetical protein
VLSRFAAASTPASAATEAAAAAASSAAVAAGIAHARTSGGGAARHARHGSGLRAASVQGITLVHYSAPSGPYLRRKTPFTPPNTPRHLLNTRKVAPKQSLNAPPIPQKALTLSPKVDECKPLPVRRSTPEASPRRRRGGRRLHEATSPRPRPPAPRALPPEARRPLLAVAAQVEFESKY